MHIEYINPPVLQRCFPRAPLQRSLQTSKWYSMAKKQRYAAYVVRQGRKPGIYRTWSDCEQQIHRFPKNDYQAYVSVAEAEAAWAECKKKNSCNIPVSVEDSGNTSQSWADSISVPSQWSKLPAIPLTLERSANFIDLTNDFEDEASIIKQYEPVDFHKEGARRDSYKHAIPAPSSGDATHAAPDYARLQRAESPVTPQILKRSANFTDLTNDPEAAISKRYKPGDFHDEKLENQPQSSIPPPLPEEEVIQLSGEQEKVFKMALHGDNIFLTGAAGCGKTVTLKAILKGLKRKGLEVQVVAPTGIAALPLNGKTTFSFAGVSKPNRFISFPMNLSWIDYTYPLIKVDL